MKIYEVMLEKASEENLAKEIEAADKYKKKYIKLKLKWPEIVVKSNTETVFIKSQIGKRKFQMPTIELKSWMGIWKSVYFLV